jgi:hypothetical protein
VCLGFAHHSPTIDLQQILQAHSSGAVEDLFALLGTDKQRS